MSDPRRPNGFPAPQGLYHPDHEHDACGIGFVVHARGARSHRIVRQGLELLENLSHRGATGCDPCSGDGAGILLQLPDALFRRDAADRGVVLPPAGAYAVGMLFLPADAASRAACERVVERVVREEGRLFLGWRDVPVEPTALGSVARATLPAIRQCFVARGELDEAAFDRLLLRIRRRVEKAVAAPDGPGGEAFHVASLSPRTLVLKGLLLPSQLPRFFDDLRAPETESAIALVHSRFSTNTFPTWARAHPYRLLCHNGEINTLRGNRHWMRVREGGITADGWGDDPAALFPIVADGQSDSACLDNALEFLVTGGRSLPHAVMMLMPEAFEENAEMDPAVRGFFDFHGAVMEPWDGPAAVAFTDGRVVGAALDRNGLRPGRYVVTHDDVVVLASEAGVLPVSPEQVRARGRLRPGKIFLVDTVHGLIREDEDVKAEVAARHPYGEWVARERVRLAELPFDGGREVNVDGGSGVDGGSDVDGRVGVDGGSDANEAASLLERQAAFGLTAEEVAMILTPMATAGTEPTGSMGTDTPLAVLSDAPQPLFRYFKQLFAQVTNPPIDPLRERLVMSLATDLGPRRDVLQETPAHARRIRLEQPVLDDADLARLRGLRGELRPRTLRTLFSVAGGTAAMAEALDALCRRAAEAVRGGCGVLVLSDRGVDAHHAAIPSLLAVGAVHHHLIREGLRTRAGLVADTGEAREVAHFALLLGYGAEAVSPYLVWETLAAMADDDALEVDAPTAAANFVKAVGKGLRKVVSKMGISTLQSYTGAQVFEALGLAPALVERHFTGTASRIGGIGVEGVAEEVLRRHRAAFSPPIPLQRVDAGGEYHFRTQGEHHHWSPLAIARLQQATRRGDFATFREFSREADEEHARFQLRGLLEFVPGAPVPLDEVEPAAAIVRRFCTGAMSFGSISREAHETLAVAMNRLGGRSNTGEGGEDPARFADERNSRIKQVASGRFGVTTDYLVHADELQIKIAQGAKPGEGGQLPGHKVDAVIARTRHSTPGVSLISPPPHHDIYSIEDLAQLIADLKMVNPGATVSVKLVAEAGVGTVAAGVVKAHADLVVISGDSGGTGASPLSSIKYAGIPWELGLAETQQTLVLNDLRGRVTLQTDGGFRTGRDVVMAALLGAEEFGFATAPLVVEGCVMMRKCHLNTCPVGIATQDPVLRARFTGQPEHVVNYFFFVAEEVRALLAELGFRTVNEMVGRTDRLRQRRIDHWKAATVDLGALLHRPEVPATVATRRVQAQDHGLDGVLDHELIRLAVPAIEAGEPLRVAMPLHNVHRGVGAMLSGEIARRFGGAALPRDAVHVHFTGAAGQSFGAFLVRGVTLSLEGEANDYVGKGLSGGRLVIGPSPACSLVPGDTTLLGNTALYGATAGEAFFHGRAGERFAVRNSGATAVVEGVGDHGCEYMTGGRVVVLGPTGRNFAAGMSGGVAFVLDDDGDFARRCNTEMVALERVDDAAEADLLRWLVGRHARLTGSTRAHDLLRHWAAALPRFVRVMPLEYRRVLARERAQRHPAPALVAAHG